MNIAHPSFDEITLSGILYALGDPVRLRIAQKLFAAPGPLTCSEAVSDIPGLAISTRSHCFKILREKGVLVSEVRGREHYNQLRLQEIEAKYPTVLPAILS